jgi:hypothetical protein
VAGGLRRPLHPARASPRPGGWARTATSSAAVWATDQALTILWPSATRLPLPCKWRDYAWDHGVILVATDNEAATPILIRRRPGRDGHFRYQSMTNWPPTATMAPLSSWPRGVDIRAYRRRQRRHLCHRYLGRRGEVAGAAALIARLTWPITASSWAGWPAPPTRRDAGSKPAAAPQPGPRLERHRRGLGQTRWGGAQWSGGPFVGHVARNAAANLDQCRNGGLGRHLCRCGWKYRLGKW